jgi:hypothetical protein
MILHVNQITKMHTFINSIKKEYILTQALTVAIMGLTCYEFFFHCMQYKRFEHKSAKAPN